MMKSNILAIQKKLLFRNLKIISVQSMMSLASIWIERIVAMNPFCILNGYGNYYRHSCDSLYEDNTQVKPLPTGRQAHRGCSRGVVPKSERILID
ncbi:MAG: hypothetical protein NTX61_15220 [Bacteroidetes bacterium]|nr:hypothetical protein [Bacteroidota bacterium]